jgi:hypothetical protein
VFLFSKVTLVLLHCYCINSLSTKIAIANHEENKYFFLSLLSSSFVHVQRISVSLFGAY